MRRTIVLFLVLSVIVVLAASCAPKTTVTQTAGKIGDEKTTPSTTAPVKSAEQPAHAQPDIAALTQSGLDCLAETHEEVCRPVNYAIASVGDTVGFAFGVQNNFPSPKKIAIKVNFVRRQPGGVGELPVEVDKDFMQQWTAVNDLEPYYELQSHEKLSKPILIKVGDFIGKDKPTVAGAYIFEIKAQTYEKGFYEDYGGAQQITVRVK